MGKIKKVVLPVGGLGTRFLPATKSLPKEMLPINNKPLIQFAFEEAKEAGIEEFIFITGRNKSAINNHFDHVFELETMLDHKAKSEALLQTKAWLPEAGNIVFIRQQQPLGLGHAIWCARNLIANDEPFAVILADELFITNGGKGALGLMMEEYERCSGNLIALSEVPLTEVSKYGIIKPKNDWVGNAIDVDDLIEKPRTEDAPSNLSITGRYILDGRIFNYLAQKQVGSGGEIQLTDAMRKMNQETGNYRGIKLAGKRLDCGNPKGFFEAILEYSMIDPSMSEYAKEKIKQIAHREALI